jgi:nicotinamidase/pyrazinamidase
MNEFKKIHLLVIDPQNDFCDIPSAELPVEPRDAANVETRPVAMPALPVSGADADMKRLAAFIDRVGPSLTKIHVTLDSHHPVDIAHPMWWRDSSGEPPAPFTVISGADVRKGVWSARDPRFQDSSVRYVEALENSARYLLVIWPEHCLIGSWGHNVHAAVRGSLERWARAELKQVDFVIKGMNPTTEHYSAIRAEVPDPNDASTGLNDRLIKSLSEADLIIVAGEALSHCVANTVRDIASNFKREEVGKLILLTDCASSVGGFEALGADFVDELTKFGMKTANSTELLA